MAPANQLRLSFTGSEDGEAETETCRAAKLLWRKTNRTSGPQGPNLRNRRMRTRLYGGVAGENGRPFPLCRLRRACSAASGWKSRPNLMEVKGSEAQGRHREVGSEGSVEQRYGLMDKNRI